MRKQSSECKVNNAVFVKGNDAERGLDGAAAMDS
jgi:hypothetical protein